MVLKRHPSRLRSRCSVFSSAALSALLEARLGVVASSSPILQVVSLTRSSFIMMVDPHAPYDTLQRMVFVLWWQFSFLFRVAHTFGKRVSTTSRPDSHANYAVKDEGVELVKNPRICCLASHRPHPLSSFELLRFFYTVCLLCALT